MMPLYRYHPLHQTDEIRLLILQPGQRDSHISCNLFHAMLSSLPQYEALSYMWGSEEDPMILEIDGHQLSVRNNLWQALKHLRPKEGKRIMWVDALCIDQENNKERNHQVEQMSKIFAQAQNVCVWLGLVDDEVRIVTAFGYLNELSARQWSKPDASAYSHLYWLCNLPYWSRLWIIQEIVLATKITIHSGYSTCGWESLDAAFSEIPQSLYFDNNFFGLSSTAAMAVHRTRESWLEKDNPNDTALLTLWRAHRTAKCSDIRDQIFGLHSFALECCRTAVPIDYSLDKHNLCRKVLHHYYSRHATEREQVEIVTGWTEMYKPFSAIYSRASTQREISSEPEFRVLGYCVTKITSISSAIADSPTMSAVHGQSVEDILSYIAKNKKQWIDRDIEEQIFLRRNIRRDFLTRQEERNSRPTRGTSNITSPFYPSKFSQEVPEAVGRAVSIIKLGNARDCVLFVGDGMRGVNVGFAPIGTSAGDLICKFRKSKVAAVIRHKDQNRYSMIGRAIELRATGGWEASAGLIRSVFLSVGDLQILARSAEL